MSTATLGCSVAAGVFSNPLTAVPVGLAVLAAAGLVYYGVSCSFPNAPTITKVVYTAAICLVLAGTAYSICFAISAARHAYAHTPSGSLNLMRDAQAAQQAAFIHQQQVQAAQQLFDQQQRAAQLLFDQQQQLFIQQQQPIFLNF